MTYIVGIDNGNHSTKTAHCNFHSGLTKHDTLPSLADDLIQFNNYFYTLRSKRNPVSDNKTKDETAFVLSLFAISKELLARGVQIDKGVLNVSLAVGLPPGHYGLLKHDWQNYFLSFGEHINYVYNDLTVNLHIDRVNVFPQAFAAIAKFPTKYRKAPTTFICDIGGWTLDLLKLSYGRPNLEYNSSYESGILNVYNNVKKKVSNRYMQRIEEEQIEAVLRGGNEPVMVPDRFIEIIQEEARNHTLKLLKDLREDGVDLTVSPAIFVGGGALCLEKYIRESGMVNMVEFVPDVQANAQGYEVFLRNFIEKENKN